MKKEPIPYLVTGKRFKFPKTPEEFEAWREKFIKVFSSGGSNKIITETDNKPFDNRIKEFKRTMTTMKKQGIETVLMKDKERISDNEDEVYCVCKIAEEKGIEIQFSKENISSKDVIKQYENNDMTGMEMNL